MPARNRFLQSRWTIWLIGLIIQLKRAGLGLRRFFVRLGLGLRWMVESVRVWKIQARRAGLRVRRALQNQSAWTLGAVTGTLGILLMIVLQLMYSFQMLGAKESPENLAALAGHPKTRIDPGLPQTRKQEPQPALVAQIDPFDPFTPSEPDPFAGPPQDIPPEFDPNLPAREPVPRTPISEPIEPEHFIDPLDNLPPFDPLPMETQPREESPTDVFDSFPAETHAPAVAAPNEFPEVDSLPLEPLPPAEEPYPEPAPSPAMEGPSRNEPEPFIDPLDTLPPFDPVPLETDPGEAPVLDEPTPPALPANEPEPFLGPLDNLPPFEPVPGDSRPAEEFPAAEPATISESPAELGLGVLHWPKEDEEWFLLESGPVREKLSQELRLDAWDLYYEQQRQNPRPLYWERLSREDKNRLEQNLTESPLRTEYDPGPEPARTELNLGIEKVHPEKSTAYVPVKYEIIIKNRGGEMIDLVDVDEAVPPSHQLTDVSPAGYFESHLLRWRLRELRPGESRRLSVEVVPTETGPIETTTSVRPTMRVIFLTQVENSNTSDSQTEIYKTPLRLRRSGYRTVSLAERVLFTNHVQNLSGTTQREVEIVEQVPAGFRVIEVEEDGVYDRSASTITWRLAALPAGQTAKLGVHLEAESTGELVSRVKGVSSEGEAVPIKARVQVIPLQAERISTPARSGNPQARCSRCASHCCCPASCCR